MQTSALVSAQGGSREAFESLVNDHSGLVFSIGLHFLGNRALAEEIAQDVFLELYRNLQKMDSPAHLLSWLRRCTSNRCIDLCRKSSYKSELPISDTFHPASAGAESDLLLTESLKKQVAALPEMQRAVVILRYQEDLDPDEIARILKIPVNTVKSRLFRAIETLRERFERKKVMTA